MDARTARRIQMNSRSFKLAIVGAVIFVTSAALAPVARAQDQPPPPGAAPPESPYRHRLRMPLQVLERNPQRPRAQELQSLCGQGKVRRCALPARQT